jgi:ERCC4-related helicase
VNDLIQIATAELARFLGANLTALSTNWWQQHVVERLSFQQQRIAQERSYTTLEQLDFAALLRVLDQNWNDLAGKLNLPTEGRHWVKELQTVRNKWAHLSAVAVPPSDIYRDADTLGRLLKLVGASPESLAAVEKAQAAALRDLAVQTARTEAPAAQAPTTRAVPEPSDTPSAPRTAAASPPAPLFKAGDLVALRSNPAVVMPIIEVVAGAGEYRYRVFQNNTRGIFYESQLQAAAVPDDTPTILSADELRGYLTALQLRSPSTAHLYSLRSGRVIYVPYQYRPALKLIRADRPRLLIADEVGVGKTIEAGLIIKELRARMDLASVLIICPKPLVAERKWAMEMKRFDEQFTALNGPALRHCLRETHLDGEWPEQYAKAILPFSLFDWDLLIGRAAGRGRSKELGLLHLDPPPKFDLVIVDEAHHIRNSETCVHQAVRYFCDNAQAVLFLSATPVQLGSEDLFVLLNVLRPDLVIDPASFALMAEPNRHINAAVQQCRRAQRGWPGEARAHLARAAHTEWGRLFLREAPSFQQVYDRLAEESLSDADRVGLVRTIEEFYTFSSLINRTRRRDIGEFTTRKPETYAIEFTPAQRALHDDLLAVIARILAHCHGEQNVKFMMTTIRRQAASCLYGLAPLLRDILGGKLEQLEVMETGEGDRESDLGFVAEARGDIAALLERAKHLDPHDPKVEAFLRVLRDKQQLPNNKALVFSTFRHTLAYLAERVQGAGMRYGLIHGGVPDEARAELRSRFSLPREHPDALDVLLSSEVGCEGLDFQFCDFLVNYDLPWNPMRIEQRIGRIDRYGQQSPTVAIANFITPGTVDAEIYDRCLWRIGVFEHAVGGTEEILGQITQKLHEIAERFDLTPEECNRRLQQLADNSIREIAEEQALEAAQVELLGLNVPNAAWRQELAEAESQWLSPLALERCVRLYLGQRLGMNQDYLLGEKALKTLRLGQDARSGLLEDFKQLGRTTESAAREWEKWLRGGVPTLAVTFDQATAAATPKAAHLAAGHPLIQQAARGLQLREPAYTALTVACADVPAGEYRFGVYHWRKQGVKPDETLVAVAAHPGLEARLLALLQTATTREDADLPDMAEFAALDARHHALWRPAQADHSAANQQIVAQRIQSLKASHGARRAIIEDQFARATDQRIRIMKQSELARAEADFARRMQELEQAANSGDIHAAAVLFGTISIGR